MLNMLYYNKGYLEMFQKYLYLYIKSNFFLIFLNFKDLNI